ncbi:plasmid replication initiator TrfA [Geobacter sp. FeAm09]|uniref:plasmid replication initiator TrfA n=1 Tax=Geobacter sp. FeAm09 TaxID=2597769 RepID=UPI00143DC123|nr:plasmid replication initiator TrfA [Geobacter sp. FeAm09]
MKKNHLPTAITPEAVPKWIQEKAEEAQLKLQLFLPFCAPEFRQIPNEIVRSALFTCRNRNTPRENYKKKPVVVIGDGNIIYQGEELRQDDEAVWMHLIYLAREVQLGEAIQFVPHVFLHDIRWPTNGSGYDRLRTCLDRMAATGLTIISSRLDEGVNVSLIRKIEYSAQSEGKVIPLRVWRVWIEPEMRLLFDSEYLTCIRWEMYHALRSGVAKKLFLYWSSHKAPFPVKTDTMMELCSTRTNRREFRRTLSEALGELQGVGFLACWKVSSDLWTVKRDKITDKCGS